MDDDLKKPTKRTKSPDSSPMSAEEKLKRNMKRSSSVSTEDKLKKRSVTSPSSVSAEEKLKRSMKGLSHVSGGGSGLNLNASKEIVKDKDKTSRKKVGGVVLDIETIQDANKQKFETKGRRNNVIILVLSLLLVVSFIYLAIAIIGYNNSKKQPNCRYLVEGDASAEWIVEGGNKTEFLISKGLGPDTIYNLNSVLKINTTQSISLTIHVKVMLGEEEILIAELYKPNENLERIDQTNKFVYQGSITGGGNITIFEGIDFTSAPAILNSNDAIIEIIAYVNKL